MTTATSISEIEILKKQLAEMKSENERLKAREAEGVTLKVSEKGALSVYGMGRFPVTLYPNQWEHVFSLKDRILTFIDQNKGKFKTKEQVLAERAKEKAAEEELARLARIANMAVAHDEQGRPITVTPSRVG
ncbi:hypothetical protein [Caudoviricetes sp.]|nr:hypothetical protein [Caudoviricetes sp.]UOF81881.1 hypothetical protein [Caudoviricetes sp.]